MDLGYGDSVYVDGPLGYAARDDVARVAGQYGMLVLARHPIETRDVRTFQMLRWSTMPGARQPADPATGQGWYAPEAWSQLRLSSKSHWDVPVRTPMGRIHLLAAHPTPPVFDGPENRNGLRNHDDELQRADIPATRDHAADRSLEPGNEVRPAGDERVGRLVPTLVQLVEGEQQLIEGCGWRRRRSSRKRDQARSG